MWKPDPSIVNSWRNVLAYDLAAHEPDARSILETAGQLQLAGCRSVLDPLLASRTDVAALVKSAFPSVPFESLDEAATDLVLALRDLAVAEEDETAKLDSTIVGALHERDRIEFACVGYRSICGEAPPLTTAQNVALRQFEGVVRPELWRLTRLNWLRPAIERRIEPSQRRAFWWWNEGIEIAAGAVDALAMVAPLLATFPAAREELDSLVAAHRRLEAAKASSASAGSVISMDAWIRKRLERRTGVRSAGEPMAVGFSGGDAVLLVRDQGLSISWREPDQLVVDFEEPPAQGSLPVISFAGGTTVTARAERDFVDRFVFVLDATMRNARDARLRARLERGEVEVPFSETP